MLEMDRDADAVGTGAIAAVGAFEPLGGKASDVSVAGVEGNGWDAHGGVKLAALQKRLTA